MTNKDYKRLTPKNAVVTGRFSGKTLLDRLTTLENAIENETLVFLPIDEQRKCAVQEFADEIKAKLLAIFGKTICSDLDTEDITDIIDELLEEYKND